MLVLYRSLGELARICPLDTLLADMNAGCFHGDAPDDQHLRAELSGIGFYTGQSNDHGPYVIARLDDVLPAHDERTLPDDDPRIIEIDRIAARERAIREYR